MVLDVSGTEDIYLGTYRLEKNRKAMTDKRHFLFQLVYAHMRAHMHIHKHRSDLQISPQWCIFIQFSHTNSLTVHVTGEGNYCSVGGKSIKILHDIV